MQNMFVFGVFYPCMSSFVLPLNTLDNQSKSYLPSIKLLLNSLKKSDDLKLLIFLLVIFVSSRQKEKN